MYYYCFFVKIHTHALYMYMHAHCTEIQLGDSEKPLLLMSSWQSLLTRHVGSKTSEIPRLFVRRNVFISPAIEKSVSYLGYYYLSVLMFDISVDYHKRKI